MCSPASFVLTKDRVFWSKNTDSHTEIIAEHGLHDSCCDFHANIVKVEIMPLNRDMRVPLDRWHYCSDQDRVPTWYNRGVYEPRVRAALRDWAAAKLHIGMQKVLYLDTGEHYCYDCSHVSVGCGARVTVAHGTRAELDVDSASVTAQSGSFVRAYGDSTVHARGNAIVWAGGRANVYAAEKARVFVTDDAAVHACDDVFVVAKRRAYVDAGYGSVLVVASDSSIVRMYGNTKVCAFGSSILVREYTSSYRSSPRVVCVGTGVKVVT